MPSAVRRAGLLAAALLWAWPAAAASPDPDAGAAYWHLEARRPFFAAEGDVMVPRRPRARARPFPRVKAPGTARVFVLGGSVAHQYDSRPEPGGWPLERVLERAFPGRRVEVVHCGMGAYDSAREALILEEVLGYDADAVVLMSGNNEDRADAGPPSWRVAAVLRVRRALRALGVPVAAPRGEAGVERGRAALLRDFEATLRGMVRRARARGAAVVLCSLPRQLGLPPRGFLPLQVPLFARAWGLLERGAAAAAQPVLRDYVSRYPGDPIGAVWLGRALERSGRAAGARAQYLRALELSSHVPQTNEVVRRVSLEEGAALADLEGAFEPDAGEPRNAGLFLDAMHWARFADPRVSLEVARALAQAEAGPAGAAWRGADLAWLSGEGRRLRAFRPGAGEREELFKLRLQVAFWAASAVEGGFSEDAVALFENLIDASPGPTTAVPRYKEPAARALAEAVSEGTWFAERAPDWRVAWARGLAHLGEGYRRRGARARAAELFGEALRQEPGQEWVSAALAGRPPASRGRPPDGWKSPILLDRAGVERAFAAFRRGDWDAGFAALRPAADELSPWGLRALRDHCAGAGSDCAAWSAAEERMRELNDEGIKALLAGDAASAARSFDRVLAWQPTHTSALMNRAAAASAAGELDLAVRLYGRALQGDASAPGLTSDILSSRALISERLGRRLEAAADLRAALRSAPADWPRAAEAQARRRSLDRAP